MEKRIEQTYIKFIKALSKLLKEKDYEDISISEICEAADVKRPTFYNNFGDKENFIIQLIRFLYKKRPASLDKNKDFKDYCREFTFYCLSYIEKIRKQNNKPKYKIETSKLYYLCFGEIQRFLKKGYKERAYKDIDPIDEDFFVYRMASRILAFLIFFYNSDISIEEMKKHVNVTMNFHYIWYRFKNNL